LVEIRGLGVCGRQSANAPAFFPQPPAKEWYMQENQARVGSQGEKVHGGLPAGPRCSNMETQLPFLSGM
jgi:hypothetical protein